jgi:hypothetical protein
MHWRARAWPPPPPDNQPVHRREPAPAIDQPYLQPQAHSQSFAVAVATGKPKRSLITASAHAQAVLTPHALTALPLVSQIHEHCITAHLRRAARCSEHCTPRLALLVLGTHYRWVMPSLRIMIAKHQAAVKQSDMSSTAILYMRTTSPHTRVMPTPAAAGMWRQCCSGCREGGQTHAEL